MAKKSKNNELPINPLAVWRIIGLAVRAGLLQAGSEAAIQAIRRQNANLVIIAEDIAENSGQKIVRQCEQAEIPYRRFGSKTEIGHWTGHDERAVVVVKDPGFAGRIIELIDTLENQTGLDRQHENESTLGG